MNAPARFTALPPSSLRSSQLKDVLLWLLRRRQRFRVVGNSMQPLLQPQTEVLINPFAYRQTAPTAGDMVVIWHPLEANRRLIKWVVYVENGESCFVKGLNPEASTDSRDFGLVPRTNIVGQVVCRFP